MSDDLTRAPDPAGEGGGEGLVAAAPPSDDAAPPAPVPAERASDAAGQASDAATRDPDAAKRDPDPAGHASDPATRDPDPAGHAPDPVAAPAAAPEWDAGTGAPARDPAPEPAAAPAVAEPAEPDEDSLRVAEALVFASAVPVSARALSQILPDTADADAVLAALRARYAGRGVELVATAGGVQFRTAPDVAPRLRKVVEVPRRLPRVAMETLAIIAYHQPCTRGEIEEIRGTSLSQQTLDALLEANLVAPQGRREVPGRPTLWGTTPQFLAQFGLQDLRDLPQRGDLLLEPPRPSGVSDAPPLTSELPGPPEAAPAAAAVAEAAAQAGVAAGAAPGDADDASAAAAPGAADDAGAEAPSAATTAPGAAAAPGGAKAPGAAANPGAAAAIPDEAADGAAPAPATDSAPPLSRR